jgi:hypothetical protein
MRSMLALVLALVVPCFVWASPQMRGPVDLLQIDGMEPMTDDDLANFTALAMRLADAGRVNPRVVPMLEETLSDHERGIVKRAVAYLALVALGREDTARIQLKTDSRDQAVVTIVRACLNLQESLTAPGR